ncbi:MAG: phosphohistidine phosphatase SixA [Candidatus Omnitrophica bacterium]|nr:phosphohistidine phosphatase SixA [Candidatus Omnitrophota bacterium]
MNLYLVRHGEALSADVNPERPLSDTGAANVKKMAESLKRYGVSVDTVFHSTKKRAEETARILAETLNPVSNLVEKQGLEPNDPVDTIFREIFEADGCLMIVGHLPFLRNLAERLLAGSKAGDLPVFKPGSVLSLAGSGTKWEITGFASPDLIG